MENDTHNTAQRWPTLTALYASLGAGIPAILIGHTLYGLCGGMKGAFVSLLVGNALLFCLAILFAYKGVEKRMPFIELVRLYLGENGAKLAGVAFIISLTGWFALQLEFISKSLISVIPFVPYEAASLVLGSCITLGVACGLSALGRLASFLFPGVFCVMGILLYMVYDPSHHVPVSQWNLLGMPLVLASCIAYALDAPTFLFRADRKKDALIACAFAFFFFGPLMGSIGIFFAAFSGGTDFIQKMTSVGGPLWKALFVSFIVCCGWMTNNGNLFTTVWASTPFYKKISFRQRAFFFGGLGILLSMMRGLESLESYLSFIGILESAVGASLVVHFFTKRKCPAHLGIIVFSGLCGIIGQCSILSLTGFGFLDAFMASFFLSIGALYMGEKVCK